TNDISWAVDNAKVFVGDEALHHEFSVASSIDSLVVGEREIITQVRNAYDKCDAHGLTGDMIRLVIKKTIEVAKDVYTHTNIAKNPVSVVSLAYRKLRDLNVKQDARFLIIGSGVTNSTMAKYLTKHQFSNFTVFNRTLSNAQKLAEEIKGKAFPLSELKDFKEGFDVIVTCTGSSESVITPELYKNLVGNDRSKKVVIDLAIPNDLDAEILNNYDVNLIAISNLQEVAKENLLSREQEMGACKAIIEKSIDELKQILKTRKVELAMSEVPKKVKEIRVIANEVFAKDLENLDVHSKEVLDKILAYMEKKYISVPMKMAKDILIEDAKSK
ncbi:MAG: NAD(P)-binding domain-containing protein, partial [Bacteroidetes bacterium]|nr:NAD(P)-binding domain-containing protein [Bacteroidota bacterium]